MLPWATVLPELARSKNHWMLADPVPEMSPAMMSVVEGEVNVVDWVEFPVSSVSQSVLRVVELSFCTLVTVEVTVAVLTEVTVEVIVVLETDVEVTVTYDVPSDADKVETYVVTYVDVAVETDVEVTVADWRSVSVEVSVDVCVVVWKSVMVDVVGLKRDWADSPIATVPMQKPTITRNAILGISAIPHCENGVVKNR